MGKKNFKKRFNANKRAGMEGKTSQSPLFLHISQSISWKIIFTAITIVIIGYILLAKVDPIGKNIYSALAPVFLIGGHIMVAFGFL
ncbi:MAG: hypothetical protein KAJ48_10795, partial [Elusimicrobiales bacterium]|nr:hypothetical protein [Elusimicrobiales bacterium]